MGIVRSSSFLYAHFWAPRPVYENESPFVWGNSKGHRIFFVFDGGIGVRNRLLLSEEFGVKGGTFTPMNESSFESVLLDGAN